MDVTPFASTLLATASTALFFLVGHHIQGRQVSPASRTAQTAFVTWWYCLGSLTLVSILMSLPGFPLDLRLFLGLAFVQMFVLCVALAGLLYYLMFLFTSRRDLLGAVAVGYALCFVFLLYYILRSGPTGVESTPWGPAIEYARPIESGPVYWIAILLLVFPPFLSALGYLSLYWKSDDPFLKRRILLVSLSIIAWFGSGLVGSAAQAQENVWWQLSSRLIGLAATATIYYAYAGLKPQEPEATVPPAGAPGDSPYELPSTGRGPGLTPGLSA